MTLPQPIFEPHWSRYSSAKIMDQRICDLVIPLRQSWLQECVDQLYFELGVAGFEHFAPRAYLGDEWCTPERSCMISVPFFLTHARLREIEKEQMQEVEGEEFDECMRLLRHEAGHCFDHCFQVSDRRDWRRVFGARDRDYQVDEYPFVINSRDYVINLKDHYAQAHPLEDFAETFAVWLDPDSDWEHAYAQWPGALKKLRYVDRAARRYKRSHPADLINRPLGEARRLKRPLHRFYTQRKKRYD